MAFFLRGIGVPMTFVIYPSMEGAEGIVSLIKENGGTVEGFKEEYYYNPATPNAITLLNLVQVDLTLHKKNRNEKSKLLRFPNDGFDIRFIQDYLRFSEISDLNKYRLTPSSYQKEDEVNDVLLHKKSWKDLNKLDKTTHWMNAESNNLKDEA